METHDLIRQLSKQATPVKHLESPERRFFLWMGGAIGVFIVGLAVLGIGFRSDILKVISDPHFLIEGTLAIGVAALAGLSAFFLSVPGEERSLWTRWLPLMVLPIWIGFLGWRLFALSSGAPISFELAYANITHGSNCAKAVLLVSVLPAALIFWMLRKAAPLKAAWSGSLAMLSVGALGSLVAQFICQGSHAFHIFFWHFCPCVLISIAGLSFGAVLLRFRPHRS